MSYPISAEVVDIAQHGAASGNGRHILRTRSFVMIYSVADESLSHESEEDYFVLLPATGAQLEWEGGVAEAPPHSVVIMPRGRSVVRPLGTGTCVTLFAGPSVTSPRVDTFGGDTMLTMPLRPIRPYTRVPRAAQPAVHVLDTLPNSVGMPRAKLFQTQTMSINWVEYTGPRDRRNLSPHSHPDFEQASLALAGRFVHHFRVQWEKNADNWREDRHIEAGPGTVALIPPGTIHTTEGIGSNEHILIDIFAPPRDDFIAKGQILNASGYEAPTGLATDLRDR